tara:strand:- start:147 stop:1151 length:1005 start_codon:yes stop_codon:yes gene_type:complete
MAFLDNSGDIILDAVLTDVGRKRMAQGDFRISKFSVGDDEIDYQLYNKNHPSGSAYYDLEILQTPVLEAFTQVNANINYGLTTYSNQNLLYLPSIVLNEKTAVGTVAVKSNGVIYLCDNLTTDPATGQSTSDRLSNDGSINNVLIGSSDGTNVILIETGISTTDLTPSSTNQSQFIVTNGLLDNNFMVSFDSRFIQAVQSISLGSALTNASADGDGKLGFSGFDTLTGESIDNIVENYRSAAANGFINQIYENVVGSVDTSVNFSAITGPRASFCGLSFLIQDISQQDYIDFGKTNQTQGGGTETYDFIDTTVYVRGASTNVTLQLPIRIIKLS